MKTFLILFNLIYFAIASHPEPWGVLEHHKGKIEATTLKTIKNSENLKTLTIQSSQITEIEPKIFANFPKLEKVVIANNKEFPEISSEMFAGSNVKSIELVGNKPGKISDFHGLNKLEKLMIFNHPMKTLKSGTFKGCDKLKDLEISRAEIDTIENGAFEGLSNLEELNLQRNNLKELNKMAFEQLGKVKKLNVGKNKLEKLTASEFPAMASLKILDVEYNPIKTLDVVGIEKVAPKLSMIEISGILVDEKVLDEQRRKSHVGFFTSEVA